MIVYLDQLAKGRYTTTLSVYEANAIAQLLRKTSQESLFCRDILNLSREKWKYLVQNLHPDITGTHIIRGYELYHPNIWNPDKVWIKVFVTM